MTKPAQFPAPLNKIMKRKLPNGQPYFDQSPYLVGKDGAGQFWVLGDGEPAPVELRALADQLGQPDRPASVSGGQVTVTRASDIRQRATRWLWHEQGFGWLPLGGMTLLAGREGIGKSTWGYRIAAQVTRGTLPGSLYGQPRAVVIAATEDAWEETIVPRLIAAGADLELVIRVDVVQADGLLTGLTLPRDYSQLRQVCEGYDVALILLDPLMGTISNELNSHNDQQTRQALEPLSRMAHDLKLTIIGLIHHNKSDGADLGKRVMGSTAFNAVARGVLTAIREKTPPLEPGNSATDEDTSTEVFFFGQSKTNLGRKVGYSIRYMIVGVRTGFDEELGEEIWSSAIRLLGTVDKRIEDLAEEQAASRPAPARNEAASRLSEVLTAGPLPRSVVMEKLDDLAPATVDRAARALSVLKEHRGREVHWSLPPEAD